MSAPIHPDVARVGDEVGRHLDNIAALFKPGAKLTLLVRSPESVEGSRDLVLTNDKLDRAISALKIRLVATSTPEKTQ